MRQTKLKLTKHHHAPYMAPILTLSLTLLSNIPTNTSALDYQSSTNIQFTLNPTISISVSDNLVIDNLSPGTVKDSNIVNVNVSTNNVTGYVLTATVGSSTNPSNELRHIGYDSNSSNSNSNYKFTSTSTDTTELSNLEPNTWGYNYSTGNGTTWHNYSTLPLYTDAGTTLNYKNNASNDNIKFKIGAKASSTQAAGTYTNTINFYAVAHDTPKTFAEAFASEHKEQHNGYYTMQDMSSSICAEVDQDTNIQLIDIRDSEIYTIAKLKDGKCWMLDNLALDPLTADINSDNTNATEAAITNFKTGSNPGGNDGWSTEAVVNKTSGWNSNPPNDAYAYPYVNVNFKNDTTTKFGTAGSGKIGVYYNYCAATVGTYCYASGAGVNIPGTITDAPIDICPANWRMPTGGSSGEYQALCTTLKGSACTNEMDTVGTDTNSLQYNLDLPLSGRFWGSLQEYVADGYGRWWSSTWYSGNVVYNLRVDSDKAWSMNIANRNYGFSLRCLAK